MYTNEGFLNEDGEFEEYPPGFSPAQKALLMIKASIREDALKRAREIYDEVYGILTSHKCVAFVIACEAGINLGGCWPSLGTAVQLLLIARGLENVVEGQLLWDQRSEWTNPFAVQRALKAVADCASLIKTAKVPFVLLAHVHGQPEIETHFEWHAKESCFELLGHELAKEIAYMLNVKTGMPHRWITVRS